MPDDHPKDAIRHTRLQNESDAYLAKREELRLAEIESMKLRERVAELRRQLPQGAVVEDYAFVEGPADLDAGDTPVRTVRLSELFSAPDRALVIYHLMYGKRQTKACPMCTLWIDGFNGVAHHLAQNVDFAIVAAADPPDTACARAETRLEQAAPAERRRREHVQIRPRQRGSRGQSGLDGVGVHPGFRRHASSLLQRASPYGQRHQRTRHRPVDACLQRSRPHAPRAGRLVRVSRLRVRR